jgi:hypothetical protein
LISYNKYEKIKKTAPMAQTTLFGPISLSLLYIWATQLLLSFEDGLTWQARVEAMGQVALY